MRLHHVNVVVPPGGTDRVVAFYELLGMRRVGKPTEGVAASGAWLDLPDGGTQLHLSERDGTPHPEQHFALAVEALAPVVERLVAAGHSWSPRPPVEGSARGTTRDPAGNLVELMEVTTVST